MSTSCNKPVKTPSQALRIADFDFFNWTGSKQSSSKTVQRRVSALPSNLHAKRIVELCEDNRMAPPSRSMTSKKTSRSQIQPQKNYLSTTKKQIPSRKTDHTIAKRALNFVGNQVDDLQLHPKSKPITRKSIAAFKCVTNTPKFLGGIEAKLSEEEITKEENECDFSKSLHRYDLRSYNKEANNSMGEGKKPVAYTQYRNVMQTFDDSVCEENSPKVTGLDRSILEMKQVAQTQSDASDVLCNLMINTNISSPQYSKQMHSIQSKLRDNIETIHSHIVFLNSISNEIDNHKKKLMLSAENNKEILGLVTDLLTNAQSTGKFKSHKSQSVTPLSRKSFNQTALFKVSNNVGASATSNVDDKSNANNYFKKPFDVWQNVPKKEEEDESKENIEPVAKVESCNSEMYLRKAVLLKENNKKNNAFTPKTGISQVNKKILSPTETKNKIQSPKGPCKNLNIAKASPKRNVFKVDSPVSSKSLQIYKSLKDSVNFLKTPVGKKSVALELAFETPNTRSRNITSNNIKRQLETLYDS